MTAITSTELASRCVSDAAAQIPLIQGPLGDDSISIQCDACGMAARGPDWRQVFTSPTGGGIVAQCPSCNHVAWQVGRR